MFRILETLKCNRLGKRLNQFSLGLCRKPQSRDQFVRSQKVLRCQVATMKSGNSGEPIRENTNNFVDPLIISLTCVTASCAEMLPLWADSFKLTILLFLIFTPWIGFLIPFSILMLVKLWENLSWLFIFEKFESKISKGNIFIFCNINKIDVP